MLKGMKKINAILAAALLLMAVGCEERTMDVPSGGTTRIHARIDDATTRLSVNMNALSPVWVYADEIAVQTENDGWQTFKLKTGVNEKFGTFEGTGTPKVGGYAIYPASALSDGNLNYQDNYEFRPLNYDGNKEIGDPVSQIPMVGKITAVDNIRFSHVGGAIALQFEEITTAHHQLIVKLEGAPVTGIGTIDTEKLGEPVIPTSGGNTVTIDINKTTSYAMLGQKILVPVPQGTYNKISIDLQVYDKSKGWVSIVE